MRKLAAWHLWLEGCALCTMMGLGVAQAAQPELVIATEEDVGAFAVAAPFELSNAVLNVQTSFSTARDFRLSGYQAIHVAPDVHFELAGEISSVHVSGGVLEKRGRGTLRLAGTNTYAQTTGLREGTLQLAGDSPLGNSRHTLEQSAGTVLELEAGSHVGNHIELWPTLPGYEALPGLEGVVEWKVPSGVATLGGSVSADLPVHKTGMGTLRLMDLYMGQGPGGLAELRVMGGGLAVGSNAHTRVRLGSGTWLEGAGRVAELHVGEHATVAPGGKNGMATFTVTGDAYFDADSLFHVNVAPDGRADLLKVSGLASLDGQVFAAAEAGDWARDTNYVILSAGDLGGSTFAGVETDLAFLDPSLKYEDQQVYLTLTRNDLKPGDIADDPEEEDVGNVISPPEPPPGDDSNPGTDPDSGTGDTPDTGTEPGIIPEPEDEPNAPSEPNTPSEPGTPSEPNNPAEPVTPAEPGGPDESTTQTGPTTPAEPETTPELPPLEEAVEGMTVDEVRTLLEQSTGSWHASVKSFLLDDGRLVRQAIIDGRPRFPTESGPRTWARTWASRGKRSAHGRVEQDRYSRHGLALGLDAVASTQWRFGPVLGAQWSELKREAGLANAKVRSLYAGAAAFGDWNGIRVTAALLRAWHRLESSRRVNVGPMRELQRTRYLGRSWQAVVELAPHLRTLAQWSAGLRRAAESGLRMGPYLRHEWSHLRLPGFQESGGVAAQAVQPSSTNLHATTLGWRLRHDWRDSPSWLEIDLGWRKVWGDGKISSTQSFPYGHTGLSFTSTGQPLQRHALALGMEAGLTVGRNAEVSLRYSGMLGSGQSEHVAWAGFSWVF